MVQSFSWKTYDNDYIILAESLKLKASSLSFYIVFFIMKKLFFLISLFSFGLLLTWCGKPAETCSIDTWFSCGATVTTGSLDLSWTIDAVINAIKNQDLITLSTFVGDQGLRFSPYEYVNTGTDVVLITDEVYNGLALSRTFIRGSYDGSWEPIDLPLWQYREKFVYDVDFVTAPEVYHNQKFERGNTLNTIFDIYTGKEIVDYHFPQIDPQYEWIDWRSLYLVLENVNGQRKLIWIVHGQWTI